jgi:hypothetical protein
MPAGDPFCDFGDLPRSQCAHCRRQVLPFTGEHRLPEGGVDVEMAQRYIAARYSTTNWMTQARNAPSWGELMAMALPELVKTSEDWEDLSGRAAVSGFGPWTVSQFHGVCAGCGYRWVPDEMIRFSGDEGRWVCSDCGSAE